MPHSWCGKRLGWERPLQPSGSAAATQQPVQAATDMGMALKFFSTMSEAFRKKYMMFTTMGHMVRHPHHFLGGGNNFRRQSAHRESRWRRGTLQRTANNTKSSQCDGANVHPR